MKFSKRTLGTFRKTLSGPEARFYAFAAFFVIVFFTGGGSRDDIQSLLLLRPLAVLFCAYALIVKVPGQWSGRQFPLYIIGALLALMILQLIPLPPAIWTELPERRIFADIANIAGIEQPWRPLSLSPSKTMNSLFSLAVPIAAMMLYLNLDREHRKQAIPVIIVLCAVSALWAIFQMVGPSRGPLYLYRITNSGFGVGLFANRNHQAVILASAIIMLGWYAASQKPAAKLSLLKFYMSIATIFVLVPLIFVTGSRAGLLLMIPALILSLFFVYFGSYYAKQVPRKDRSRIRKSRLISARSVVLTTGIVGVIGISLSSILLSRSAAYDRLFKADGFNELRVQLLPTLFEMLKEYMPFGSGFGSFEHVYRIYEPQELLSTSYLNQAHNDWLQLPIEGGIPAVLIAISLFIWLSISLVLMAKKWRVSRSEKYLSLMCLSVIVFFLIASIIDYPLRVPSVMAVFAVIICVFNDSIRSIKRRDMKP